MTLLSSFTLVAAVLAFFDASSAQMVPTYTYVSSQNLGPPVFSPPAVRVANPDWVFHILHDLKWNQLLHDPSIQKQLEKVLNSLKNYTHTSKFSPTQLQQVALHHENIYNFMHHFAEILRYHPDWKVLVYPYVQQHHWPTKYLNMFEQMMLFFLLHSFPGRPSAKTVAPLTAPDGQAYPPFDPISPYNPWNPIPVGSNWLPPSPYLGGIEGSNGYTPVEHHPLPPIPSSMGSWNQLPGSFPAPISGSFPGSFPQPFPGSFPPPFPGTFPGTFPGSIPPTMRLNGNSGCAQMVNVTIKIKIYNDVTCTASVYAPRQSLKNILAIAAQDNDCFKFNTQRRASRAGGKQGEFVSSVNTIDENDVSRWSVNGKGTKDAELNSYKPTNGEVITVTFYLVNRSKTTRGK